MSNQPTPSATRWTDRDRTTTGYRELRALIEDLLEPPPAANPDALLAALHEHLRMHCRTCGELLEHFPRARGDGCCAACVPPGPAAEGHR